MTSPEPPLQNLQEMGSSIDIEGFMNQPGNATIVNAIIDRNKETIMENFLTENVGSFEFGRPPPSDITNPNHPLFGWQAPQPEPPDPNIPSTQVLVPIPQNTHSSLPQSLVHTTSQSTPSVTPPSASTMHFSAPPNPPFASGSTPFSLPPHITSSPFASQIPSLGSNAPSSIPPNTSSNPFVTNQSSSAAFSLGPWSTAIPQALPISLPPITVATSVPQAPLSTAQHSYSLPPLTNYFSMPPLGSAQHPPPWQLPAVSTSPQINYLAPLQNQPYFQVGAQPTYIGHGAYSQSGAQALPILPPFQPQSSHSQYAQPPALSYLLGQQYQSPLPHQPQQTQQYAQPPFQQPTMSTPPVVPAAFPHAPYDQSNVPSQNPSSSTYFIPGAPGSGALAPSPINSEWEAMKSALKDLKDGADSKTFKFEDDAHIHLTDP